MERPPQRQSSSDEDGKLEPDSFEVIELTALNPMDIDNDDRAFIYTESGNRYMVRHSKSRGGALVIYNEHKGGFNQGNGFLFRAPSSTFASVGQSLEYFAITDEIAQRGNKLTSTKVVRIEVRKGLDKAAEGENIKSKSIADMIIDTARGRRRE